MPGPAVMPQAISYGYTPLEAEARGQRHVKLDLLANGQSIEEVLPALYALSWGGTTVGFLTFEGSAGNSATVRQQHRRKKCLWSLGTRFSPPMMM